MKIKNPPLCAPGLDYCYRTLISDKIMFVLQGNDNILHSPSYSQN